MRALSIRQPYAELILRGIKRIEYRSRATHILGERFYIYASKHQWNDECGMMNDERKTRKEIVGDNIAPPGEELPPWMIELANGLKMFRHELLTAGLPMGVIVGSAVIEKVVGPIESPLHHASITTRLSSSKSNHQPHYEWHLAGVERAKKFRKPTRHPQPVWFKPF